MLAAICIVIITIFLPPVGVLLVAGCGADFLINILLTLLGVFPGHIHAFYIEYVYFKRSGMRRRGALTAGEPDMPFIFSRTVQQGGSAPLHQRTA